MRFSSRTLTPAVPAATGDSKALDIEFGALLGADKDIRLRSVR